MSRNVLLCSWLIVLSVVLAGFSSSLSFALSPDDYFKVKVVDARTGRGVPLVKLETNYGLRFYTDSAGVAALREPGLMGRTVWFDVSSPGYEFSGPARGGVKLELVEGHSRTLELRRVNVAERIYRVTGEGIYRDSVIFEQTVPIEHPLLNSAVMGQDSVINAVYQDRLFWFWGDTRIVEFALGVFHSAGATSVLPGDGGLDPEKGVNLEYFVNGENEVRGVFPSDKEGPIWLSSLMVLEDNQGQEQLLTFFSRRKNLEQPFEIGLGQWNDAQNRFEKLHTFPLDMRIKDCRNAVRVKEDGKEWFYFTCPHPVNRVPASKSDLQTVEQWETFTPLKKESRWEDPQLETDRDGEPVWDWKSTTPNLHGVFRRSALEGKGILNPEGTGLVNEGNNYFQLKDVIDGEDILSLEGTVYWNDYRERWVMIFWAVGEPLTIEEGFIRGSIGEIWFAEADTLMGPWVYSRRIASHGDRTCYNVNHHRPLDQNDDRTVFFGCTFASTLTVEAPVSGYNYNQMMYRLDLADTRLHLPVPVYHFRDFNEAHRYATKESLEQTTERGGGPPDIPPGQTRNPRDRLQFPGLGRIFIQSRSDTIIKEAPVPFYALPPDRPRSNSIPVWENKRGRRASLTLREPASGEQPVFHALPASGSASSASVIDVYEYENTETGRLIYSPSEYAPDEGPWVRSSDPVFRAWRSPKLNPVRNPRAEPVKTCMGSSAVCN